MGKRLRILLVAVLGCFLIALPTALFFGAGDLLAGDGGAGALFTVVFMAGGLAVLWTLQFVWQSWRDRSRDERR